MFVNNEMEKLANNSYTNLCFDASVEDKYNINHNKQTNCILFDKVICRGIICFHFVITDTSFCGEWSEKS